jgi:hypothetical protein
MDLSALSLPDWMPWWAVVAILVPVAFYLALFLLMPFSTFGLRAKLREMEGQIEALHEEIRGLTLRLPERGLGLRGRGLPGMDDDDEPLQPPIPPVAREPRPRGAGGGFGDPVADKMLAYMRDKAQTEMNRGDMGRPEPPRPARPRTEPRFVPPPGPGARETELPPPPPLGGMPTEAPEPGLPPPPRLPGRFLRRRSEEEGDGGPNSAPPAGPRIDWPR